MTTSCQYFLKYTKLPDGVYKNQLGGDLTVTDGQVDISGEPMVI